MDKHELKKIIMCPNQYTKNMHYRIFFLTLKTVLVSVLIIVVHLIFASGYTQAATKTWTGGGGNNNWSTSANWSPAGQPASGDALVFSGATQPSTNNDIAAGTSFASITFSAGASAFTLAGNSVVLTGGAASITGNHTSLTMTIQLNITFSTAAPTITTAAGGTLNISGTIANGGFTVTIANAGPANFSGIISGTGGLTMSGAGTTNLSGANTFSGTTTASAGTLQAGNSLALGAISSGTSVSSGGTFDINGFNLGQEPFILSGGTLLNNGAAQQNALQFLTVSGNSSIGGANRWDVRTTGAAGSGVTINAGVTLTKINTIQIAFVGGAIANGSLVDITAGTLSVELGATTSGTGSYTVQSAGTLQVDSYGTLVNLTNAVTSNGGTIVCYDATGGASSISGAITLSGATTVSNSAGLNITGVISGANSLTKTLGGALTLSGANTFTGGLNLNAGTLNINSTTALGGTAGTFTIATGTTIDNTSAGPITLTANNPMTWNGDFTFTGTQILNLGTGTVSMGTSLRAVTVTANKLTAAGVITGSGGLTKNGTGTLKVSGVNDYASARWTGTTTINAGTLQIDDVGGDNYKSTSWIVNNGATLQYLYVNNIANNAIMTINTGGVLDFNATGRDVIGYVAGGGSILINNNFPTDPGISFDLPATGTGSNFSGVISGTGRISCRGQAGSGTQILSGLNTYTLATSIEAGTLSINTIKSVSGGSSAIGAPTTVTDGTITLGGTVSSSTSTGTLQYTGTAATIDRVINLGSVNGGGIIDQSGTGLLKFTSASTATGNGTKTLTLTGSSAGTGEMAGAIVNSTSATSLAKTGTGTWTLSGANTYTGATTVTAGTLALGAANTIAAGSNLVMNGGTLNTPFNQTMGTLTLSAGSTINLSTGNHTVKLASSAALVWSNSTLVINDWLGGYNGTAAGGTDPKIFVGAGNNVATDLTTNQLTKIIFHRASNNGNYAAVQLATGEVVPSSSWALPVTWLSFTGEKQNNVVNLEWKTGSELNSQYFDVLRSDDGKHFEFIGRVNAAGSSLSMLNYSFIDYFPMKGVNYYRLLEVDRDGASQDSKILAVAFENNLNKPIVYLNHQNVLIIYIDLLVQGHCLFSIYSTEGKLVLATPFKVTAGENKYTIDCNNLAPGVYYFSVLNQEIKYTSAKFVKIN
jgi:autotransporter-associated beta strand protein